jgi:hypothetical protein
MLWEVRQVLLSPTQRHGKPSLESLHLRQVAAPRWILSHLALTDKQTFRSGKSIMSVKHVQHATTCKYVPVQATVQPFTFLCQSTSTAASRSDIIAIHGTKGIVCLGTRPCPQKVNHVHSHCSKFKQKLRAGKLCISKSTWSAWSQNKTNDVSTKISKICLHVHDTRQRTVIVWVRACCLLLRLFPG